MLLIIFLLLVVAAFSLKKSRRNHNLVFVSGMMIGLFFVWAGFTFYLVKHNYYAYIVQKLLFISPALWSQLLTWNIPKDSFIIGTNFGIVTFVGSTLCYALSYTRILFYRLRFLNNRLIYLILGVLLTSEFLLFNPLLYRVLQGNPRILDRLFSFTVRFGEPFFRYFNLFCLALALLILLSDYLSQRKAPTTARPLLYHLLIIGSLVATYILLFAWTPKTLLRPSLIHSYFIYIVPDVTNSIPLINFFPVIALSLLLLVLYFSFKYREALYFGRNYTVRFADNMEVANQSMRIYTHSMKNQLYAILSEVEFLDSLRLPDEQALYSIDLIRQACTSALDTIDLGNRNLRRYQLNLMHQSLSVPIDQALQSVASRLAKTTVIKTYTEPALPVYLDKEQVTDLIENLLINAVEAIELGANAENGHIAISVNSIAKWVILTIEDNGRGMDESTLEAARSPFFTTKSSSTNWGLGLSISQNIMVAHRGTMSLESVPGIGTKIDLAFPAVY